jgi:hypothetical protein
MSVVRHVLLAMIFLGTVGGPRSANAAADIVVDVPPPPERAEHAPPPRDGYVWGPGHWEWSGHAYSWVSGTWIAEHRHAHWVSDRWEPMGGARWHFVPGHWER